MRRIGTRAHFRNRSVARTSRQHAEVLETRCLLAANVIQPSVNVENVQPGQEFDFQVDLTADGNGTTGLSFRVHFDSTQLQLAEGDVSGLYRSGFSAKQIAPTDSEFDDGSQQTDRIVNMLWFDLGGQWFAGNTQSTRLVTLRFTATPEFTETSINITGSLGFQSDTETATTRLTTADVAYTSQPFAETHPTDHAQEKTAPRQQVPDATTPPIAEEDGPGDEVESTHFDPGPGIEYEFLPVIIDADGWGLSDFDWDSDFPISTHDTVELRSANESNAFRAAGTLTSAFTTTGTFSRDSFSRARNRQPALDAIAQETDDVERAPAQFNGYRMLQRNLLALLNTIFQQNEESQYEFVTADDQDGSFHWSVSTEHALENESATSAPELELHNLRTDIPAADHDHEIDVLMAELPGLFIE